MGQFKLKDVFLQTHQHSANIFTVAYPKYYQPVRKQATKLRNNSTKSEILLWVMLRRKQTGVRFIRQKPIGKYIVDFFCKELGLIIEIDGDYHYMTAREDLIRQKYLESLGFRLLRLRAYDVEKDVEGAAEVVKSVVERMQTK